MTRKQLGVLIKKKRVKLGYSIMELAEEASVNHMTVRRCEEGEISSRIDKVILILKALDLKIRIEDIN